MLPARSHPPTAMGLADSDGADAVAVDADLWALDPSIKVALRSVTHRVVTLDSAPGLVRSLACAQVLLVAPRLRSGAPRLDQLAVLRDLFPHIGIYVVRPPDLDLPVSADFLAGLGVDRLFSTAADRAGPLSGALTSRVACPPPELALRALWELWSGRKTRAFAMHVVRNAFDSDQVSTIEWFWTTSRTMNTKLAREQIPRPDCLRQIGVVLHAAQLAAGQGLSVGAAASRLGLDTAKQLHERRGRVLDRLRREYPDLEAVLTGTAGLGFLNTRSVTTTTGLMSHCAGGLTESASAT